LALNTVHVAVELNEIYGDSQENNYWSLYRLYAINVQLFLQQPEVFVFLWHLAL